LALEAARIIKTKFGSLIRLEEFNLDSPEGRAFDVKASSNVFVNGKLIPKDIWSNQNEFTNYIREIAGEKYETNTVINKYEGYDVVIIGGGPAGLSAGIYCARARLKTVLLEAESLGGQIITTEKIENFPGFIGSSSVELIAIMENQARDFGLEIHTLTKVDEIRLNNAHKEVICGNDIFQCKSIILATGHKNAETGISGEDDYRGKGISYCAVCDANFYTDGTVAIVGGGDTAVEEAIYLSKFAAHVYLIHRRGSLRATKILQEQAFANAKISIIYNTVIQGFRGSSALTGLILKDLEGGKITELNVDGLFVAVGSKPNNGFLKNLVELDEQGHIVVDSKMETSVPGIFAAGDIRVTSLRQVATAVGDGAMAAISVERYITELTGIRDEIASAIECST
jgi:thioredoxin reductase (NADPH)